MSYIKLKINNVLPIKNADMDIGKINVIGGKNSTGKSTSSKLLYCFLRAISSNREDLAIETIREQLRFLRIKLRRHPAFSDRESNRLIFKLLFTSKSIPLEDLINNYYEVKDIYEEYGGEGSDEYELLDTFDQIDDLIDIIQNNPDELYNSIMETLLESEFDIIGPETEYNQSSLYSNVLKYNYSIDFKNFLFENEGLFEINEIYYVDSFSLFDTYARGSSDSEHVLNLKNAIQPIKFKKTLDRFTNEKSRFLEEKIKYMIGGEIVFEKGDMVFKDKNQNPIPMKNTASGIKQIGIIQLLIKNRRLQENTFLIIDEPEVNLHPDWQIKLAKILVLLVKELNIQLYIASHSPFLIEAIQLYSQSYDLLDDSYFYLTKESNEDGLFNIVSIESDNIEEIYRNLGKPYDALDELKMEIMFKEMDDD